MSLFNALANPRIKDFNFLKNLPLRFFITAKPRAKQEEVVQIDPTHFKVSVKEPPVDGRANEAVLRALAAFLNIPPSDVRVISGHASKKKVIEVL